MFLQEWRTRLRFVLRASMFSVRAWILDAPLPSTKEKTFLQEWRTCFHFVLCTCMFSARAYVFCMRLQFLHAPMFSEFGTSSTNDGENVSGRVNNPFPFYSACMYVFCMRTCFVCVPLFSVCACILDAPLPPTMKKTKFLPKQRTHFCNVLRAPMFSACAYVFCVRLCFCVRLWFLRAFMFTVRAWVLDAPLPPTMEKMMFPPEWRTYFRKSLCSRIFSESKGKLQRRTDIPELGISFRSALRPRMSSESKGKPHKRTDIPELRTCLHSPQCSACLHVFCVLACLLCGHDNLPLQMISCM